MACIDTILNGLAALGGVGAAVAAVYSYKAAKEANVTSKRSLALVTLTDLRREYATDQMHDDIMKLHKQYGGWNHDTIKQDYLTKVLPSGTAKEFEPRRRRVSHYFQKMAAIRDAKILEDNLLFLGWTPEDLSILGIIVPMEEALAAKESKEPSETIQSLIELKQAGELAYKQKKQILPKNSN